MNMEKQDEILAEDPTITDTEAETFPAATSSDAVGIVEEEAAETIPQVLEKKSDPYEELQELLSLQSSPLDSYKELPSFWKKQAFAEDTIRPTHVIEKPRIIVISGSHPKRTRLIIAKKQDEILAVDPTITNTEAETFPAATSSHAVGIVEEKAAETIPQVTDVIEDDTSFFDKMEYLKRIQDSLQIQYLKRLPIYCGTGDTRYPKVTDVIEDDTSFFDKMEYLKRFHDSLPIQYLKRCPIYCRTGDTRYPKKNREPNLLPLSSKDSANTSIEQKVLTWEAFLCVVGDMLDISPQQHGILLMICIGFLSYYAKNSTTPFDMQFGKTTTTPVQSLISFSEAIYAFLPEITHITKFIICYVLSWMLVLPLRPGMQIFLVLLLISAPIFYFPGLVHKASASGVHVACGSFKLPLIGFATLGAVGLSLICGFVTLLMVYLRWRFIYKGKPRVRAIEVSLDGLSEILQG